MNTNELFSVDYRIWADYWDLLEHDGLNAEIARYLDNFITGPVLLLGSGQGLLSQYLQETGYEVYSVDRSPEMAAWAMRRRAVSTIVCDALNLQPTRPFKTVVVSTGVVNDRAVREGLLPRLLSKITEHLVVGGSLLVAYFRVTSWTAVAQMLGLYGRPSNNVHFWTAQGDLGSAKRLLVSDTALAEPVQTAFHNSTTQLVRHMAKISAIGRRYSDLHNESPVLFIREQSGYYPFALSEDAEANMLESLEATPLSTLTVKRFNRGEIAVLVCEKSKW